MKISDANVKLKTAYALQVGEIFDDIMHKPSTAQEQVDLYVAFVTAAAGMAYRGRQSEVAFLEFCRLAFEKAEKLWGEPHAKSPPPPAPKDLN